MSNRSVASIALRPIAWIYGAAVACWRWWCVRVRTPTRMSIPIVSVGNITTGGTGKGPFVRWVARVMQSQGATPVIALRGYRAGAAGSDEAMEHQRLLPEVAVAVGADRVASIRAAQARDSSIDMAVLDDGFQHWRIARDLDLVLIDASRPGLDAPMLPAGERRESISSLRRASAVIVTRAERIDPVLTARVQSAHGRPPIAWCRHAWNDLLIVEIGVSSPVHRAPAWLRDKRVGVVAAIGHPKAFFDQVADRTTEAQWLHQARDHDTFTSAHVQQICEGARAHALDAVVTTMKDWVKLAPLLEACGGARGICFAIPIVSIEFIAGEAELRARLSEMRSKALRGHG